MKYRLKHNESMYNEKDINSIMNFYYTMRFYLRLFDSLSDSEKKRVLINFIQLEVHNEDMLNYLNHCLDKKYTKMYHEVLTDMSYTYPVDKVIRQVGYSFAATDDFEYEYKVYSREELESLTEQGIILPISFAPLGSELKEEKKEFVDLTGKFESTGVNVDKIVEFGFGQYYDVISISSYIDSKGFDYFKDELYNVSEEDLTKLFLHEMDVVASLLGQYQDENGPANYAEDLQSNVIEREDKLRRIYNKRMNNKKRS